MLKNLKNLFDLILILGNGAGEKNTLKRGSANPFGKGPERKYFGLYGPYHL